MQLKVGKSLASAIDGVTVIVVRAGKGEVELTCGGLPMYDPKSGEKPAGEVDPGQLTGTLIGKRYVDNDNKFELLCTKPGDGGLALDGVAMTVKEAKALPSSD